MNEYKYELAVAAYLDWCQAGGFIPERPSEALGEVHDDVVFLRNFDGELGVFRVVDDKAERIADWTPAEKAMFAAGDAIQTFVKGQEFPSNDELETAVWEPQLREKISRDAFHEVCNNMRCGWSPIGDD